MDRIVDITDISLLVAYFGMEITLGSHPTDITESGVVDISDVSVLVGYYGSTY